MPDIERKVKKLSKKQKRKMKLQAQLLDVLLEMEDNAERYEEIRAFKRILRDFRMSVASGSNKLHRHYWNDMVDGFHYLINIADRPDELNNLSKVLKITKKLVKL